MVRSTPTLWAMAIMWSTALVEPPVIMMRVMAFSNAALVMMSLGLMSFSSKFRMAWPTILHSSTLSGSSAGMLEEYGRVIPRASAAEAIVFAVYMPPHAPCPGQAFCTMSSLSSLSMRPAARLPNVWKAETMSIGSPLQDLPARMVPPYTMMEGLFRRPIAISVPGMFLSQPGRDTFASYHWALMTVSMESAIRSRDWSEKDMPSVPMDMPSLTPMVLNLIPIMPASSQPFLT
mmetsp:Transcript_8681/g.24800  ORF Transcript_8681/g.24800 Transcript_8681/m.24800 type:complete len:233 (-) Transcript_8681:429-1127(-)